MNGQDEETKREARETLANQLLTLNGHARSKDAIGETEILSNKIKLLEAEIRYLKGEVAYLKGYRDAMRGE